MILREILNIKHMKKLILLSGDPKSEGLEILTSYIMPTLRGKLQLIQLTIKEQQVLKLDKIPALLFEDSLITDYDKIVYCVCQIGTVESLILKEPEIWNMANALAFSEEMKNKQALLDKLNSILATKTFIAAVHITIVDIFVALPAIRALLSFPEQKQLEWINVYRWGEHLLNLPGLGQILIGKGAILVPLESLHTKYKPKQEPKEEPKEDKKDAAKEEEKQKKKDKKKGKEKKDAKEEKKIEEDPFGLLDIRIGKVLTIKKHPESTKLYLQEIDLGNGETRKIASGLQQDCKEEDLLGKEVVIFYNLKEKSLGGFMSHGMILCASDAERKKFEPLIPPPGSKPGDLVYVEGIPRSPVPDINLSRKKNPWERTEAKLTTTPELVVAYNAKPLRTEKGEIKAKSIVAAKIS